jgi:DNA helicase-2/ATP-dependent DNA helicase PcrA
MEQLADIQAEREYTARVQALLLAVIEQSDIISGSHSESIRAIIADAWEDLRMRPTALSPYDIEQLSAEIDRFVVRKTFTEGQAARYRRMLMSPFFARIDFVEEGETELEKIVIGLYSLKNEKGEIMVHDWRAPVCGLFYDAMPGVVEYRSPSGPIRGEMTLKRQYKMENGKLLFYVDTQLNIDDEILLDLLSGATSRHMHEIVSTIQAEQSAAIRADASKVVSVVGAAGSGKTSVAMHRAAYIMYRRRDIMEPSRIQILSPSNAFSEYISNVLPELGEENIKARTLHEIVEEILARKCETPLQQLTRLLDEGGELRRQSVACKTGKKFMEELDKYVESFTTFGPDFANVWFEGKLMIRREELRRMYKDEFKILTPAQRLIRVSATLDSRFESWEKSMYAQYEKQYAGKYRGRELQLVCRMAVSQRLQPMRMQLKSMLNIQGDHLLKAALRTEARPLKEALSDNMAAGVVWWEDAVAQAYMLVKLGFRQPDKSIYHLLVDEAQDYQDAALGLLSTYFPRAKVTLLGDPMQRTCPAMDECDPGAWGACFGEPDAGVFELTKCYRSTQPIARLCNAILPGGERLIPFGREGAMPLVAAYSDALLRDTLTSFRAAGHKSVAVLTRTPDEANAIAEKLENVYRLDGEDDQNYEPGDTVVGCYHLVKGMEFDAVIACWPECALTDEERRRLYAACSRALHAAALLGGEKLIAELGIVL